VTPRIHLVYQHGPGIATPDVIGRRLGEHLARRHEVALYNWDDLVAIDPAPGDVLVGHPHPVPGTVFRRSFRRPGWSRRLVLSPYAGDTRQVAFLDPFVRAADGYLAITGSWWARRVDETPVAHWAPRMVHLDLAVDPADFPRVKEQFAAPGRRRILYIGHTGWWKNVGYLSEIARARPDWDVGWLGRGEPAEIPGVEHLGFRDTSTAETRRLIASYDFLLTVGRADANPTTILEAMSWGLLPFCTPQSGYIDEPGIVNVPLDDLPGALAVLDRWQDAPVGDLEDAQRESLRRLTEHFTWERFGDQVEAALTTELPPVDPVRPGTRIALSATALTSPYGPLRAHGRRLAVAALRRRRASRRAP
jgi:glycosyltransferase involved in cell wall biosynthesis